MHYTDLSLRPPVGYAQWWLLQGRTRDEVDAMLTRHREYSALTADERLEVLAIATAGAKASIAGRQGARKKYSDYKIGRQ